MQKIDLKGKTVLVTGAAGFIGSNLVIELFKTIEDIKIVGMPESFRWSLISC